SGLIRHLALTAARVSEPHRFEEMVMGDETVVFADGAYAKDARKKALRSRGIGNRTQKGSSLSLLRNNAVHHSNH
ncbi:MAG: hypothetical protein MUP25_06700, partial [Syntrophales bacterium]|nr:hypothetical protein [Syntrophales bacterium]